MKQITIFLSVLLLFACHEQRDTYLITGNIQDIPDSTVIDLYAQYEDLGTRISSDTIINGKFEFSDTLNTKPARMSLRIRDYENFFGSCEIWVDHEEIQVTGKGKYLSAWVVESNIQEQQALNAFLKPTRELSIAIDSLNMLSITSRLKEDRERYRELRSAIDSINQIRQQKEFELIQKDPNSKSALKKLYQIAKFDTSIKKSSIEKVYERLDSSYKNTLLGEGIALAVQENEVPEVGDQMINFIAHDVNGQKHSLKEYKGKYILLDFWSLGCGPCIQAHPATRQLHAQNKNILTVVGVNMVTNEEMWRESSRKDSITWVNLSDGKGTIAGISADYGIRGFPTYILINPEGTIIDKWMGYWPGSFKEKLTPHIDGLKI